MEIPSASTPVVCDMTTATDTPEERLAEYQRLYAQALVGRSRTAAGIQLRLSADVEEWVRDLAAREKACCAFFAFEVNVVGDEVVWDVAVADSEMARAVLEQFYELSGPPS
jgi:hypothetical protein